MPSIHLYRNFDLQTLLFDSFALPDEHNLAKTITSGQDNLRPEDFFFDFTFAQFLKFGVPSHHFAAECVDDKAGGREDTNGNARNGLCSLAVGILNASGLVDNFDVEFLSNFRAKYLSSPTLLSNDQKMEEDAQPNMDVNYFR